MGWPVQEIREFYFAWPWALLLLLLIPAWWLLYIRGRRKQLQQLAVQFSYTALVDQIKLQPAPWRRLRFPVLFSLLMACLIVGLSRPTLVAQVPVNSLEMMLVMDISLSMMADDIRPDRLSAAKEAAIRFVDSLPRDARIGLEFFAGENYVLSPPTARHGEVISYLRTLRVEDLRPRTEIGSALHTALRVLTQENQPGEAPAPADDDNRPDPPAQTVRPPERVIVLLSDGDNTGGYPPRLAARQAEQANVTIYTVGIGSAQGGTIQYRGLELPVTFSEDTLREIAAITGGQYFRVFAEGDFRTVYENIRERTVRYEERDIDLAFAMAGLGLLTLLGLGILAGSLALL